MASTLTSALDVCVLQSSPFGEACGVTVSSLQRLTEVYGTKPERHLLGFLVRVVEAQNDETLLFLHDMAHLYKASRWVGWDHIV